MSAIGRRLAKLEGLRRGGAAAVMVQFPGETEGEVRARYYRENPGFLPGGPEQWIRVAFVKAADGRPVI